MRIVPVVIVLSISIAVVSAHAELVFNTPYIHPESIAIHDNYLWISDNAADKLYRLNLSNGSVITSADYMFSGLTFVGDYLYEECMSGVVDSIDSVWEYNPATGWSVYVPGGASDLRFMKPGYGYWIKADEDCFLEY